MLPLATVTMVKDHPEMTDWVHSLHYATPFYTSSNNYTKITVDQVQAADQQLYNILLLATGMLCCYCSIVLLLESRCSFSLWLCIV